MYDQCCSHRRNWEGTNFPLLWLSCTCIVMGWSSPEKRHLLSQMAMETSNWYDWLTDCHSLLHHTVSQSALHQYKSIDLDRPSKYRIDTVIYDSTGVPSLVSVVYKANFSGFHHWLSTTQPQFTQALPFILANWPLPGKIYLRGFCWLPQVFFLWVLAMLQFGFSGCFSFAGSSETCT